MNVCGGRSLRGNAGHGAVIGGGRRDLRRGRGILRLLLFGGDDDFESFLLVRGNGCEQNGHQE